MKVNNKAMLITYADSLGHNLRDLNLVMNKYFKNAIGGIHILPFFPSTGDRGFSPTCYDIVDHEFGDWNDVKVLSKKYYLMFDFMINHLSRHSSYFEDYLKKDENSKYKGMFLDWDKFWPKGHPNQKDIDMIYKRKNKAPFETVSFNDSTHKNIWNTFGPEQLDLDIKSKVTQNFIKDSLQNLSNHGASIIRLDAFAYAIKKFNTNDFFVEPEIWELLDQLETYLKGTQTIILPEIHEHYTMPFKVSKHGYFIYDFALPMVLLYSLYSGDSTQIAKWLKMVPMKQFTTLDTHDGLGVVDAKDILSDEQITYTTKKLYEIGANVKRKYSSAEYHNLDIYQINTTYYSALGNDDKKYFLARLLQIFSPGIPQIYYVGLLAGKNDLDLLEKTKEGRNINRHYYELNEIDEEVKRPIVKSLIKLLEFRNKNEAFDLEGSIEVATPNNHEIIITRENHDHSQKVRAKVNFKNLTYEVKSNGKMIDF